MHRLAPEDPESPGYLEDQVRRLACGYAPLLREAEAFSHTTALILFAAPIRCSADLHVTATHPSGPARGRNVAGHRTRREFAPRLSPDQLPCVPLELAIAQCGTAQRGTAQRGMILPFTELVIAIDHLICPRRDRAQPILDHATLAHSLEHLNSPGIDRVRAACAVARIGAESRYETLTRLELARLGLDSLELQVDLYDANGAWIGRFDLVDRERRKILEFDGEQHRSDREQYLKDQVRLDRARRAGYSILRLNREDFHPTAIQRTRASLCEFLDTPPRAIPRRLARYLAEPSVPQP